MKDLLIEIIDHYMTTLRPTGLTKIKTPLRSKSSVLADLVNRQFLEEILTVETEEPHYFPRMLAFELVDETRRRQFAYGIASQLLFKLRDGKRQGLANDVVVRNLDAVLALDFPTYVSEVRPVYVEWIHQVYPRHDPVPMVVDEAEFLAGKYQDAKPALLAISTPAIEDFESIGLAWDEELRRRNLEHYIKERKPAETRKTPTPRHSTKPKPPLFDFMHDNKMRTLMERDFADLQQARLWGSLRLRFVLSGSIIEGLLLDALMANGGTAQTAASKKESKSLEFWGLGSLLEAAAELKVIRPTVHQLGSPVRELRNLVHPGVEWRNQASIEPEEVEIVEKVLDLVIRDLTRLKMANILPSQP